MPDGIQHHDAGGLSEIAEQFRLLDSLRRQGSLSLTDAERYHNLFARLSDALASQARHRRVNTRQFLRVKFPMQVKLRTATAEVTADCLDFGAGGCLIACGHPFRTGDEFWLDGVTIEDQLFPLRGRAQVAWTRVPDDERPGYGLRFCIDSPEMRNQIDRLLYRVLDRFLAGPRIH
jgi:hypothetical protein